jgi:hypothetical protein
LILELFRGSFYAHDVGSEIDNIFPALPTIFEGSKEQQQRAKVKEGKGDKVGLPCFFGQLGKG